MLELEIQERLKPSCLGGIVGSSPTGGIFNMVAIVLAVSTPDCESGRMGSNPIGRPAP